MRRRARPRCARSAAGPWQAATAATAIGATPGPMSCALQPSVPRTTRSTARSTSRLSRRAHQIEKISPSLARPYNRAEVASQVTSPCSCQPETLTSPVLLSARRPQPRTRLRLSHVDWVAHTEKCVVLRCKATSPAPRMTPSDKWATGSWDHPLANMATSSRARFTPPAVALRRQAVGGVEVVAEAAGRPTRSASSPAATSQAIVRHKTSTPTAITNQLKSPLLALWWPVPGRPPFSLWPSRLAAEAEGALDGRLSQPALPGLLNRVAPD